MQASQVSEQFDIVTVASGVCSLRSREFGETFHPVVGPMAEAVTLHVRQQRLVERAAQTEGPFVIWDVGLGAAANAVAVLEAFRGEAGANVELHSFDLTTAPLLFAEQNAHCLDYTQPHREAIAELLSDGAWLTPELKWFFHRGDFRQTMRTAAVPQAILYDPYSPAANPELWTLEHFTALRRLLQAQRPCLLSNYTRSTAVRVTLLLAGFFVGRGHATGEKNETTIASTTLELLEDPLEVGWLERVRRSTRSAPLSLERTAGKANAQELQRLTEHPQFRG